MKKITRQIRLTHQTRDSYHENLTLQDFTILSTETFRRCVIRSSSVIFLPTSSPTDGLLSSAFPSSVIHHSVAISVGKTKKSFADGFADEIYAPKKKIPA